METILCICPYKKLRKAGNSLIVNLASVASHINSNGLSPYAASKGAIEGITNTGASALAPYNIRVNSIHPGDIETPMTQGKEEAERIELQKKIPLRRSGQPEDIAKLVSFLASDDSSYITGSNIFIDGGLLVE